MYYCLFNSVIDMSQSYKPFDKSELLQKAVPGTHLYSEIVNSNPVLAFKILTKFIDPASVSCTFLESSESDGLLQLQTPN